MPSTPLPIQHKRSRSLPSKPQRLPVWRKIWIRIVWWGRGSSLGASQKTDLTYQFFSGTINHDHDDTSNSSDDNDDLSGASPPSVLPTRTTTVVGHEKHKKKKNDDDINTEGYTIVDCDDEEATAIPSLSNSAASSSTSQRSPVYSNIYTLIEEMIQEQTQNKPGVNNSGGKGSNNRSVGGNTSYCGGGSVYTNSTPLCVFDDGSCYTIQTRVQAPRMIRVVNICTPSPKSSRKKHSGEPQHHNDHPSEATNTSSTTSSSPAATASTEHRRHLVVDNVCEATSIRIEDETILEGNISNSSADTSDEEHGDDDDDDDDVWGVNYSEMIDDEIYTIHEQVQLFLSPESTKKQRLPSLVPPIDDDFGVASSSPDKYIELRHHHGSSPKGCSVVVGTYQSNNKKNHFCLPSEYTVGGKFAYGRAEF